MTMQYIQFQVIMLTTKVVNYKAHHSITHRVSESSSLFVFYTQIAISSDHDQNIL